MDNESQRQLEHLMEIWPHLKPWQRWEIYLRVRVVIFRIRVKALFRDRVFLGLFLAACGLLMFTIGRGLQP